MDHIKNGQKYAVFMDRMRLYNSGHSQGASESPRQPH
jgi:hypothetical protein